MTIAGRKGKLSITGSDTDVRDLAWQRYEDVLTSDVFGAYRYLPPSLGIVPFLQHAADENGQSLGDFLRRFRIDLAQIDVVRIRFWPTFADGREPDLLVMLQSTVQNESIGLLVETKLDAGQHIIDGLSQIGHYLCRHLQDGYGEGSVPWSLPEHPRPLLFVTRHAEMPKSELLRARFEVRANIPDLPESHVGVFWASWCHAAREADRLWQTHRHDVAKSPWLRLLLDLREELRERDLVPRAPFSGISASVRATHWRYERAIAVASPRAWKYSRNSLESLPGQPSRQALYIRGPIRARPPLARSGTRCYERGLLPAELRGSKNRGFYHSEEGIDG